MDPIAYFLARVNGFFFQANEILETAVYGSRNKGEIGNGSILLEQGMTVKEDLALLKGTDQALTRN